MFNLLCKKPSNNGEKALNFIGISKHKKRKMMNPSKVWQRILDRRAQPVVTCNDNITATSQCKTPKTYENFHIVVKAFTFFFSFSLCQEKKMCSVKVENNLEKS